MSRKLTVLVFAFFCICVPSFGGPLDIASAFNVFAFNNLSATSDIGSRVAVGGNLLSNLTLGNHPFNTYNFSDFLVLANGVDGNDVTQNTGGNVYAAGYNASGPGHIQIQNGTGTVTSTGPDPINFAAEYTTLTDLSQMIATQALATGITTSQTSNIVLTAPGSNTTDYFNLTAEQFTNLAGIVTNGNTVVINVIGTTQSDGSPFWVGTPGQQPTGDSTIASNILFNFSDATSITLDNGFGGAILATNATLTGSGQANGTFIVQNMNYQGEIHGAPFTGDIPLSAAPEPATLADLGAGAILLGFAALIRLRASRKHDASRQV
jgi:choice-of-anchor A domain-containing protein